MFPSVIPSFKVFKFAPPSSIQAKKFVGSVIIGKGFTTKDKIAYEHPAIFPEKLVVDHINSWSNEGDIVLDIFGGSGKTIKIAKNMNRSWIYVDQVKRYCEIALQRIDAQ